MAGKTYRCDSRDAYAWLASTFGDKGQTLLRQIDDIRKTIAEYNLPLELFLISPSREFSQEIATKINTLVIREATHLDIQLGRSPRGNSEVTRESKTLMREMVLAILKESDYVDANERHLSEPKACIILGWRRPEHRYFSCVCDVIKFHDSINHGECFGSEANRLIVDAYERIKNEI